MNPSSSLRQGRMAQRPSRASMEGVSPLMYSCQQGHVQQVRQLLQRKPGCVRDRDRTGKTALHYCAENTGPECVQLLLRVDPDMVNVADEEGYTPLHLAVIAGNRTMIRYLLDQAGADPDALDAERHSCVHWATVCGELEALDVLLERRVASASMPDIHGAYPLHYAAQMAGQQHQQGRNNKSDDTSSAGHHQGIRALKRLVQHGVAVDVTDRDGRQPLLWAASSGSADAILTLCNAGASVTAADKDGLTALHCSASRGHSDCLETLIALCGAEVDLTDANGCTALFYAVTLGHADCAQLLLDCGANPNHQDKKGRTPAYCGATKGQMETLRLLAQHRADLWIRNARGDVPLHEAVASGRKDLVLWLLRSSSSIAQGPNGQVPSLAVTSSASSPTVSAHVVNNEGRSPLHIAAINNNVEMCKILIDHGAEVNGIMRVSTTTGQGGGNGGQLMTPLDAALRRGNRGCAKFLQLHGGLAAAKLTDSRALQRALSLAYTESQHAQMIAEANRSRRVSVTVHQGANGTSSTIPPHLLLDPSGADLHQLMMMRNTDNYPASFTDSTLTSRSTLPGAHNQLAQLNQHPFINDSLPGSRAANPIDMQTEAGLLKPEESFSFKDAELTSTGLVTPNHEEKSESGQARRRKIHRRRAGVLQGQRRSLTNSTASNELSGGGASRPALSLPAPAPNDQELRRRQRYSDDDEDDDDSTSLDDEPTQGDETGRYHHGNSAVKVQRSNSHRSTTGSSGKPPLIPSSSSVHHYSTSVSDVDHKVSDFSDHSKPTASAMSPLGDDSEDARAVSPEEAHIEDVPAREKTASRTSQHTNNDSGFSDLPQRNGPGVGGGGGGKNSPSDRSVAGDEVEVTESTEISTHGRIIGVSTHFSEPEGSEDRMRLSGLDSTVNGEDDNSITKKDPVGSRSKRPFLLRRTKSERSPATNNNNNLVLPYVPGAKEAVVTQPAHRVKNKSDIPVSVVRATQAKTRRYNLERKIFQQLLDLKQMQIRSGQANEQVFAKRLIDNFRKDALTVGLRPYDGSYSFNQLERYLYSQLRLIQGGRTLLPQLPNSSGTIARRPEDGEAEAGDAEVDSEVDLKALTVYTGGHNNNKTPPVDKCTHTTQRCSHAMYAYTSLPPSCYTGIPCAAYIPYHRHYKLDHHQMDHTVTAGGGGGGGGGRTILPKLTNSTNKI